MKCAYSTDCQRAALPTSPTGTHFANCADHHARLIASSWADDARDGVLRPMVVGGVPLDAPVSGPRRAVPPVARRAAHEAVTALALR